MVQTELNIGSELKPHNQEMWWIDTTVKNTYIRYGEEWPFTSTHSTFSNPGKGTNLYWSPEYAQPYNTFLTINGEKVSIQDDCGVYPTTTIYPQDGSKYHLDITGNLTASVDITPGNPYSIHYESAATDSEWDVTWSMPNEYGITTNAVRKKPASSFYLYTIYAQRNGETVTETTIDRRTGTFDYLDNGVRIANYNPATDVLCGYDANGNIDFQAALIPTGYYSGTGNDHRSYYGAFTTTNLSGKMISVRRYGMNVYINLHNTTDTWGSRTFAALNNGVSTGTTYNSNLRAFKWPTTNLVKNGVLVNNVTHLQGVAGGYNFDALTYQETLNGLRKLIVFDMQYNPDGTSVTIGDIPVTFKETYDTATRVQMLTDVEIPLELWTIRRPDGTTYTSTFTGSDDIYFTSSGNWAFDCVISSGHILGNKSNSSMIIGAGETQFTGQITVGGSGTWTDTMDNGDVLRFVYDYTNRTAGLYVNE